MRAYLRIFLNAFSAQWSYRTHTLVHILAGIITLCIEIFIWKAFYSESKIVFDNHDLTIADMIEYVFISMLLSVLMTYAIINKFSYRVYSGFISTDLIRPRNVIWMFLFETLGEIAHKIVFYLIPVYAVGLLIFDVNLLDRNFGLLSFVVVLNAFLINYLLCYCLGLLAFWYTQVWQISFVYDGFMKIFAGAWIPLWFFPEALQEISRYLPFSLVYFYPISMVLGKIEPSESTELIILQFVWLIILTATYRILWKKAKQKLNVLGG